MPASPVAKPHLLGINHVALEVGDIDEALAFYGRFFDFTLQGRPSKQMAFIEMGDQFLALSAGRRQNTDDNRHFGLVVDDREGLRARLEAAGVELVDEKRLDFLDPWGNRIEIVPYADIQFLKDRAVLEMLGADRSSKTDAARNELRNKGIKPPDNA
ncbi:MAG TPA: VOC family protein [Thermohalobaculum sp.]|nr:VOC family protein [Thermohalobaculum sp.]